MKKHSSLVVAVALALTIVVSFSGHAQGPGPVVTGQGALYRPFTHPEIDGILVPEASREFNAGRVLFVDRNGRLIPLISGLPSALTPQNQPIGPTAVHVIENTVLILIGNGNSAMLGPVAGTEVLNPSPASPIFSSLLALELPDEETEGGFVLTPAQHAQLAQGTEVKLLDAKGRRGDIRLVADFPNGLPDPTPAVPNNVDPCNPYTMTGSESQVDIADAGCNQIRRVDVYRNTWRTLAVFPPQPNTGPTGPPVVDAVPTGVRGFEGNLIVSLLTGAPFGPGAASIFSVNPTTGAATKVISGLQMVTDVLVRRNGLTVSYWVLEFGAGGPGRIIRYDTATSTGIVITNTLITPTGMEWDTHGNILVSSLNGSITRVIP